MCGVLAAIWLSIKECKRRDIESDHVWDMVPWLLFAGIIGARLWHVLTPSKSMGVGADYYFNHPIEIIKIRQGGLGIPGAVIGGFIALLAYTKKKKLDLLTWADIVAPGLALAQAIGRWGNFVNQELYGPPTDLPWAIFIDPAHRLPGYEDFSHFHPMFLYESLWNLMNCLLLLTISRKMKAKLLPGDIFGIYLVVYPIGRFLLEFIRLDASFVGGVNANQMTMAVVALASIIMMIFRHRKKAQPTSESNA
jgi:phosphatidylglycerol:prolipoprotein diacylglycerol transferase